MRRKKSPLATQSRYDTSGQPEAQFEPGSRRKVLKNLLGIKSKALITEVETQALDRALDVLLKTYDRKHRFTAPDICKIHRLWLGVVYEWAGHYRNVNLSKGKFSFAAARHVSSLMHELEEGPLREHTPCSFSSIDRAVRALAEVHTELVLIHPFREGNGRTARLLATLMASQAGLPLLNFGVIGGSGRNKYVRAIHAGMARDYKAMEHIFRRVIEESLKVQKTS